MRERVLVVLVCLAVSVLALSFASPAEEGTSASIETVLDELHGLPIAQFFDASYEQILLRGPETVTSAGLSRAFGVRNDRLTDVSPEYILDTYGLYRGVLDLLHGYDRSTLSEEDRLSYDIYEWILDDVVRGEPFAFHQYPVNAVGLSGWSTDATVVNLFADDQPLSSKDDLADYLARLGQVRGKMDQLVDALRYREDRGILIPRFMVEMVIARLEGYLGIVGSAPRSSSSIRVEGTILWSSFNARLGGVSGLSARERQDALASAREGIRTSFIPGFLDLLLHMEEVLPRAPAVGGATSLPDGAAFYAYRLHDQTTLDLTADEVRDTGLAEVSRVQAEMRQAYADLGLDPSDSLLVLRLIAWYGAPGFDVTTEAGRQACLAENRRVLARASEAVAEVCSLAPGSPLEVRIAPAGSGSSFYAPGALDGSRPGVYYANVEGDFADEPSIPVVAYHEGVPGHYFQMTVAAGLDLPLFRRLDAPTAYVEGWALYAEQLASELGLYTTPLEKLAQLDLRLQRACRLVVDAGIHGSGWSAEEAATYWETARGSPPGSQLGAMGRYVAFPGQGSSYLIGMLKIMELRQRAEDALQDRFSVKELHDLILGNGPMPLPILESLVDAYIAKKLDS